MWRRYLLQIGLPFSSDSFKDLQPSTLSRWRRRHFIGMALTTIAAMIGFGVLGNHQPASSIMEKPYDALCEALIFAAYSYAANFAGYFFYGLRCRDPWSYGILEVLVGIIIAMYSVALLTGGGNSYAGVVFAALGAIYIIVRGLDNMYRSIKEGTEDKRAWNRNFFLKDTDTKLG